MPTQTTLATCHSWSPCRGPAAGSRDRMLATEADAIYWSAERMTRIFGFVGGAS